MQHLIWGQISFSITISPGSQYTQIRSWELTSANSLLHWRPFLAPRSSWPFPSSPRWYQSWLKKTFPKSNQLTCKPTTSPNSMCNVIVRQRLLFTADWHRTERKNDNGTFWAPMAVVGVGLRRAHPRRGVGGEKAKLLRAGVRCGTLWTTVLTTVSDLSVVFVEQKQNCGHLALNLRCVTFLYKNKT